MSLPFFFEEDLSSGSEIDLSEETSRHIHVLRIEEGEKLRLTNGKGLVKTCEVIQTNKKASKVTVHATQHQARQAKPITIAISLIKNNNRFEWFIEKATEIGVSAIIPLLCERTEKQHFRFDRMRSILISAMLQSQQSWLPVLHQPVPFDQLVTLPSLQQKYIAHCMDVEKKMLSDTSIQNMNDSLILIGPEGDFTEAEINKALQNDFLPVSLGDTRLRTETAGVVACVLLNGL